MATKSTASYADLVAQVESVPMPMPLTPATATVGAVATMLFDDEGKLYKITEVRNATQVNVVREDGKKFYMNIGDMQASDRTFPALPDYLPVVGDMVTVKGVRGVGPGDVLFVGSVTRGKAKCYLLDNSHRSVSLPLANLTKVEEPTEVRIKG